MFAILKRAIFVSFLALLLSCSKPVDTQLIEAAGAGDYARTRDLVAAGANVNARAFDDWLTPLVAASKNGHLEVVKLLLDSGADINRPDGGGTPLYWAAFNGRRETLSYLLSRGARLNADLKSSEYLLRIMREKGYSDLALVVAAQLEKEARKGS